MSGGPVRRQCNGCHGPTSAVESRNSAGGNVLAFSSDDLANHECRLAEILR